jgi:hypothetical protein
MPVLTAVLGALLPLAMPAPAHAATQVIWKVTESSSSTVHGTWVWDKAGKRFAGRWYNGAQGWLKLEHYDDSKVVLARTDARGVTPGLTARYEGKRKGNHFQGSVEWTYKGKTTRGTWQADQVQTGTGAKPPPRAADDRAPPPGAKRTRGADSKSTHARRKSHRRPSAVLTLRQATELFRMMASYKDISFRFPADGCYARAHLMVRRMQRLGYKPGKVWSFARSKKEPLFCRTPNDPRGYVSWGYHVAPTVRVRIKKKVYALVIDPSMFDRPVKVSQWGRAQKRNRTSRMPFICKTKLGQPPRRANGRRAPGTGYWPSADPRRGKDAHAMRVMRLFKPWEGRSAPKKVMKLASKL